MKIDNKLFDRTARIILKYIGLKVDKSHNYLIITTISPTLYILKQTTI